MVTAGATDYHIFIICWRPRPPLYYEKRNPENKVSKIFVRNMSPVLLSLHFTKFRQIDGSFLVGTGPTTLVQGGLTGLNRK